MNIFISYNRQSQPITTTLANDIEEMGHETWYDQELSGGQSWWDQILSQIRDCDVFVFVLEEAALNSIACKREYIYADALGKPILPVLVSDGISTNLLPTALSKIQFIDYRNQDRSSALRLARSFNNIKIFNPLPNPLPPAPEAPISYLGGLTELVESNSALSFEQQSTLVVDLRRSLRDSETAADTQTLLKKLRKRRDLYATIAEDIDELIGIARKLSSNIPTEQSNTTAESFQPSKINTLLNTNQPIVQLKRWKRAFIGAIVGSITGFIHTLNGHYFDSIVFPNVLILGSAAAITLAISEAPDKRKIFKTLITFIFSFYIFWFLIWGDSLRNYYYSDASSSYGYGERNFYSVVFCAVLSSVNVKLIDYLIHLVKKLLLPRTPDKKPS
ncbi:MAG: toll/interleukin-1 receptor domain-containing protein [Methylococcaceae bacterium]|nr:toll/interleukin-1 receptor domain-containing protein [Methylococcaceae bacterium]